MKHFDESHRIKRHFLFSTLLTATAVAIATCLTIAPRAIASSHSDAPPTKLDPQANLTDVYAFITEKNGGQRALVVEVSVRPFSEPGDGVNYDAFSPDALYNIHIANPTTGEEVQRYDFKFSPVDVVGGSYKNTGTILHYGLGTELGPIVTVGDALQKFVQTYDVYSVIDGKRKHLNSTPLLVPPPNVGNNTTPSYPALMGGPFPVRPVALTLILIPPRLSMTFRAVRQSLLARVKTVSIVTSRASSND